MSITEKQAEAPQYCTIEDHNYLSKRIRDTNAKIRLLVRILVDKKIIGTELAKSFEETSSKEILEWYLKNKKTKKE